MHRWTVRNPFCHKSAKATAFATDVLTGSNPMHRAQKRKASIAGGLTIQWWAMRDVRVRLRRPLSLRRFAPRVLRWKTLRVSSAPHPCGFESHVSGTNKNGPLVGTVSNFCGGRCGMSACGWRRPLSLRRFAPRVLRWKTLRVSSAPHPVGFESHVSGTNKNGPLARTVSNFCGGR